MERKLLEVSGATRPGSLSLLSLSQLTLEVSIFTYKSSSVVMVPNEAEYVGVRAEITHSSVGDYDPS